MKITETTSFRFTFYTLITAFLIISFLFSFYYFSIKKQLDTDFTSKGKFLIDTYSPIVTKAVASNEDIALISSMQNIMEQPDVIYAYVLGPSGRILAHNKANEIGKTYDDKFTQKKLNYEHMSISRFPAENSKNMNFDFSAPLYINGNKIGLLSLGFSSNEIKTQLEKTAESFIITGIIVLSIILLTNYYLFARLLSPLNGVKQYIEDAGQLNFSSNLSGQYKGEFLELAQTVKKTVNDIQKQHLQLEQVISRSKKQTEDILGMIGSLSRQILIITDNENRIIHGVKPANEILSSENSEFQGKHLLDVTRNVDFIELLKKSSENPNKILTKNIKSMETKIITLKDINNNLTGTIVAI